MSGVQHAAEAVRGLTAKPVEALRYAASNLDPYESTYAICSLMESGCRALDVGCGTGSVTALIAEVMQARIVGIEPNDERASAARAKGLNVVTGLPTESFLSTQNPFDCILFADVLEHLEDPYAMLAGARKAIAPGGRVVASIPNVAHWTVRLRLMFGVFAYEPTGIMDATHLRWFTKASIIQLFEASGYQVTDIKHSVGAWMPVYKKGLFRYVSEDRCKKLLWQLSSWFPGLFACQFIVSARPA
jgi:2-polyprenyl-3-methyl-5-hydroxy-6-metoxy-1,4-benzoquinol methylase